MIGVYERGTYLDELTKTKLDVGSYSACKVVRDRVQADAGSNRMDQLIVHHRHLTANNSDYKETCPLC